MIDLTLDSLTRDMSSLTVASDKPANASGPSKKKASALFPTHTSSDIMSCVAKFFDEKSVFAFAATCKFARGLEYPVLQIEQVPTKVYDPRNMVSVRLYKRIAVCTPNVKRIHINRIGRHFPKPPAKDRRRLGVKQQTPVPNPDTHTVEKQQELTGYFKTLTKLQQFAVSDGEEEIRALVAAGNTSLEHLILSPLRLCYQIDDITKLPLKVLELNISQQTDASIQSIVKAKGNIIRSLNFSFCTLSQRTFEEIAFSCPELQLLHLNYCTTPNIFDCLAKGRFPKLASFKIFGSTDTTKDKVNAKTWLVKEQLPQLRALELPYCTTDILKEILNFPYPLELSLTAETLTDAEICSLIASKHRVKFLNLSSNFSAMKQESLEKIASLRTNIGILCLRGSEITSEGIVALAKEALVIDCLNVDAFRVAKLSESCIKALTAMPKTRLNITGKNERVLFKR
jgi:hypothetical protein